MKKNDKAKKAEKPVEKSKSPVKEEKKPEPPKKIEAKPELPKTAPPKKAEPKVELVVEASEPSPYVSFLDKNGKELCAIVIETNSAAVETYTKKNGVVVTKIVTLEPDTKLTPMTKQEFFKRVM